MASAFAHLHVHTEYSALDGLAKVSDVFRLAAEAGQSALAVTDHGTLAGLWRAQKFAERYGVKLIPGMEAYLAYGSRFRPDTSVSNDLTDDSESEPGQRVKVKKYMHLIVLAENETGWANLVALHNRAESTKVGKYPLIDLELLHELRDGLIVLTACLGGPVLGPLAFGNPVQADANLSALTDAVGQANVYVEIMEHGIDAESAALPAAVELARKHGLSVVATNDAHYGTEDQAQAHDAWLAIRTKARLSDTNRYRFHGEGYFLRTEAQMRELRTEDWWQEAVSNTAVVADRVAARVLPRKVAMLPTFPAPEGFADNIDYFVHLVTLGARQRYGDPYPDQVKARLNYEAQVIIKAGFVDYMLLVAEMISWEREQGGLIGSGRGSAAGSIVCFCLGVTDIDPLEHGLLFERFLEEGRPDYPDIDTDFQKSRREAVLNHLNQVWGSSNVALIGSVGAAKPKRALGDAARVLDAYAVGRKLSNLVPFGASFAQLRDESNPATAEFRAELARTGATGVAVAQLAEDFDEAATGYGIHACGIVIADRDLTALIPMRIHPDNGRWVSEWDHHDVEEFGLVKFDVLALRNLDIVAVAAGYVREFFGEDVTPTRQGVPAPERSDDPRVAATWRLLQEGRTEGVFQMESPKMKELARQVKPDTLADLSAVIALYRPGPISAGMPQVYARRKNAVEAIDYGIYTPVRAEQEWLRPIFESTYSCLIYQEQMMRLGGVVGGFDVTERNFLRKAVGKKDKVKMAEVGRMLAEAGPKQFTDDAGNVTSPVFSSETVEHLFELMKGSGDYLFNASHSYAYAQLSWICAYLKANWPSAYGAAILATTSEDEKRASAIAGLIAEGVQVLAPDVNVSEATTIPEGLNAVRLGLTEPKSVGIAGERVFASRQAEGEFSCMADLLRRVRRGDEDKSEVGSGQWQALIESGACDRFGPRLGLSMVLRVLREAPATVIPDVEWGVIERSSRQRARILTCVGESPLSVFQAQVVSWNRPGPTFGDGTAIPAPAIPVSALPSTDGTSVRTIGVLTKYAERAYSKGRMANLTVEGSTASIEGVLWDRVRQDAEDSSSIPPVGSLVAVEGDISVQEVEVQDEATGEFSTQVYRQLRVRRVFPVRVDDPVRGRLDGSAVIVPVFATTGGAPSPVISELVTELVTELVVEPVSELVTELVTEPALDEAAGAVGVPMVFDDDFEPAPTGAGFVSNSEGRAGEVAILNAGLPSDHAGVPGGGSADRAVAIGMNAGAVAVLERVQAVAALDPVEAVFSGPPLARVRVGRSLSNAKGHPQVVDALKRFEEGLLELVCVPKFESDCPGQYRLSTASGAVVAVVTVVRPEESL